VTRTPLLACLCLTLAAATAQAQTTPPPVPAQTPPPNHVPEAQGEPLAPRPTPGDSTAAFKSAAEKMRAIMDIPFTGNADEDFVARMLVHDQGAIDLAQVELQYGRNPMLKRMAQRIVDMQERQMTTLRRWQTRRGQQHAK